ncbi:MAG: ethanolamine ammonia-lyase subunit EutB [Planctomycetota bacterium]|nr:ethanolamine ammonia-lyase subunit EutB [Planctomycetota bacterium]
MKVLTPLVEILVPDVRPDETYTATLFDRQYSFDGLKALLGAADYSKAGERNAGLAASTETAREAARGILSRMTLQHLHDHPLTDENNAVDSVMRVNYDIDLGTFATVSAMTVGELKNHLLCSSGDEIKRVGEALTGVMAAAIAKLCDVHELILRVSWN